MAAEGQLDMSMIGLIVFIITFGAGRIFLHLKYGYGKQIEEKTEHLKEVVADGKS